MAILENIRNGYYVMAVTSEENEWINNQFWEEKIFAIVSRNSMVGVFFTQKKGAEKFLKKLQKISRKAA